MARKASQEFEFLADFLSNPNRPEGTLSLMELRGFLFAVACAPEPIMPSHWMPLIFDGNENEFETEVEAERFTRSLMTLYNETNEGLLRNRIRLPPNCKLLPNIMANFEPDAPISAWSRGFVRAHDWLRDLWDEHVPEDPDGDTLGLVQMNLAFFHSRPIAEAWSREVGKNKMAFDGFAEYFHSEFEDSMRVYAELGRPELARVRPNLRLIKSEPGRNEPCPCGSGKKFKKCCSSPGLGQEKRP